MNKFKTYFISTWGAGTPDYLVTAATKERAWELVEEDWRNNNLGYFIGDAPYSKPGDKYQTVKHLREVEGFYGEEEKIVNLRML